MNNQIDVNSVLKMVNDELENDKDEQGNSKEPINKKAKKNLGTYGFIYITCLVIFFVIIAALLGKGSWKVGVVSFLILSFLTTLITLIAGAIRAKFPNVYFFMVLGAVLRIAGPGNTFTFWPIVKPDHFLISLAESKLTIKNEEIELAKQSATQVQQGLPPGEKDSIIVDITGIVKVIDPFLFRFILPGDTVSEKTEMLKLTLLREFQGFVNDEGYSEDDVIGLRGSLVDIIDRIAQTLKDWGVELVLLNLDRTTIPPDKIEARRAAYTAQREAEAAKEKAEGVAAAKVIEEKGLAEAEITKANGLAEAYFGKKVEDMDEKQKAEYRDWLIRKEALGAFTEADKIISDVGSNSQGVFGSLLKAETILENGKGGNNKS